MQTKIFFAIATLTMALTSTVFGQWHPDIDKVKARKVKTQSITSPRDVASGQATGKRKAQRTGNKLGNFEIQDLKSPRDSQTGQATGNPKATQSQDKLGNFEIQDLKSPRDPQTGQATGKRQHKTAVTGVVAGQNSGGTITNQRSRRPNRRK